jgi:hypothetical protein
VVGRTILDGCEVVVKEGLVDGDVVLGDIEEEFEDGSMTMASVDMDVTVTAVALLEADCAKQMQHRPRAKPASKRNTMLALFNGQNDDIQNLPSESFKGE